MDRIDLLTRENNLLMVHQQEQSKALLQGERDNRAPPSPFASLVQLLGNTSPIFDRACGVCVRA
jgi:hypothetical protein